MLLYPDDGRRITTPRSVTRYGRPPIHDGPCRTRGRRANRYPRRLAEPLGVALDDSSGDVYLVETTQAVLRITR
jgi:hypothetical protein